MFQQSARRLRLGCIVSLLGFGVAPAVTADVVYSNFDLDMAFDTDPMHSWTINGFLSPEFGQQAIAQQFTPSGNYTFTDAQVAVFLNRGPDSFDVFLQEDYNGLPGTVIERISISGLGPTPVILSATSTLSPILQDGTPYWLTLVAGADGVVGAWSWNSIGDASDTTFASTQGGSPEGPWGIGFLLTRSAFQINGIP